MNTAPIILLPDAPPFTYEEIQNSYVLDFLKTAESQVKEQDGVIHRALVRKGEILMLVKELLPGYFIRWCRTRLGISEDTAENTINVARNLPTLPDDTEPFWTLTAKYEVAGGAVTDEIRRFFIQRASPETPINKDEVDIKLRAPLYLQERYYGGFISRQNAARVTHLLMAKRTPEPARLKLIEWGVEHPVILSGLLGKYEEHVKTRYTKHPSQTWEDIVEEGGVLNGINWAIPVKDAQPQDWSRFLADRQIMHLDKAAESFDWYEVRSAKVYHSPEGKLVAELNDDMASLDGVTVYLKVRVPRKK